VALLNRYYRSYYITKDKHVRLTIDSDLSFFNPRLSISKKIEDVIIEIKSPVANPVFLDFLPLQLDKSSKYVMGL
jgi:hypothetical protein